MLDATLTDTHEALLWNDEAACRALDCGRTLLWRLERRPDFPKAIRIGRKYKRWDPAAIRAWIADQQREAA